MDQSKASSSTVCREFYEKFPQGKERVHKELVRFLANHPTSRKKLNEWILSEEPQAQLQRDLQEHSNGDLSKNGYDDLTFRTEQLCRDTGGASLVTSMNSDSKKKSYSKCDIKSKKARELGNEFFKKKHLGKSLHHYNQAIKYSHFPKPLNVELKKSISNATYGADSDGTCLSIALANRSAVFYELGDSCYGKALKDIDLALKYRYPERLKTKLIIRKARIMVEQGNRKATHQEYHEDAEIIKARQLLCKLIDELETVKSSNKQVYKPDGNGAESQKINEIEMQIEKLVHISHHISENIDNSSSCIDVAESFSENVQFESACNKIFINTSQDLGRHVIASSDLNEGDVLFKELPFASVLLPEFYNSHCHHCHKLLHSEAGASYFFPCKRCTQVLFCDDLCADAAELYHIHECGWLDLLHSVGIAHLAVRIILVAGVEEILKCTENHSSLSNLANLNLFKQGMHNYHRVFSLVDHIKDMFEEDLFQYSLTAGLLTQFLISKSSFLHGISEDKQFQVGGALLRHICQLVCNAHAVTDVLPDEENVPSKVIDECQKRIATAIFPAASIMNHSCDSNITFNFINGKQLIVKGARAIKKGENVYNCYGPHFRRMPRADRQEILMQQYFFACECDKCTQELHDKTSFADQFQALKCDKCEEPIYLSEMSTVECVNCGENHDIKVKMILLNVVCDLQRKGDYLLEQGRIEEAAEVFHSCYTSASKILFKCNSQFGKICDTLARCSVMTGNLKAAKRYLKQSLKYVEVRFGETSLEYSRESQKYREVCAEC